MTFRELFKLKPKINKNIQNLWLTKNDKNGYWLWDEKPIYYKDEWQGDYETKFFIRDIREGIVQKLLGLNKDLKENEIIKINDIKWEYEKSENSNEGFKMEEI